MHKHLRRLQRVWIDWPLCHHAYRVHFFCSAELGVKTLPMFVQAWKQWTSKRTKREDNLAGPFWQEEFFDHVLRSSESYSQKWNYIKQNPVRAALVKSSDEWPWQGEVESLML